MINLLDDGAKVAIVSGGLQQTAKDIAAQFPSTKPWSRRWGGIDRFTAGRYGEVMILNYQYLPMVGLEVQFKTVITRLMISEDIRSK